MTPWKARQIAALIDTYEQSLPAYGWPNWVLVNHDQHRLASRIGLEQARVAAMLLLTLRGTPTLYQGDELGLTDVDIPPELMQDPWEKNIPGLRLGRDPERTPMQWDSSPNAGFTTGTPWLPVAPDFRTNNVEAERNDPHSMLMRYRRLIDLRRTTPALEVGTYVPVHAEGDVLAFRRTKDDACLLIVLNLGHEPQQIPLDERTGRIILSTHLDRDGEAVRGVLQLRPDEGVVVALA